MKTLSIDLETYSDVDLTSSGVYRYAEAEAFEILLFGYAYDDEPVQVIDLTSEYLPEAILADLTDPNVLKTAYNANFERTCLASYLGKTMPADQWEDTMILAAELGLPKGLADVGKVIGLAEEEQKMKEGRALIQYFSKPCKPTKTNGQRTRNLPEHDPEKWATYIEYNRRDVETERLIRKKLKRFKIDPREHELWAIDQAINDRGVGLDAQLALNAYNMDQEIKDILKAEAKELTVVDNPNSVAQIKAWIKEQTGVEVKSLDKRVVAEVLKDCKGNKKVEDYLAIRKQLGKTSTAKYKSMLACKCEDKRIRGLTQFYGASRTGRWAGRLVQMQNLPQNKLPDKDLDMARELVKAGSVDTLSMLYDPADTLSQLIRTAFVPKPGHKFIVADFSAIEARVLAWLAGEYWRLEVFRTHGKIYETSAERMFHLPEGSVKKGDPMRQKGKIAELALGYGGSVGALKSMGALDMGLEEEELKPIVDSWRAANPHITGFWWDTDRAVRQAIQHNTFGYNYRGIQFTLEGPFLRIYLPSGRAISYYRPAIDIENNITYLGSQLTSGWGRIESYGPKFVENIVQAVSRDCLAESMRRLETRGIPIVFHVHDEVICEVPEGSYTAEDLAEIMGEPISWAPGLPLRADAYECEYYRKD